MSNFEITLKNEHSGEIEAKIFLPCLPLFGSIIDLNKRNGTYWKVYDRPPKFVDNLNNGFCIEVYVTPY
jgi:hypothetical protein